jgi:hypothetical protein
MFCLPEELEYNFSVPTNNSSSSNSSNMAPHFNGGQTANGLTSHHQHQQQQQQPQPVSNGLDDSFLAQMPPLAPLTAPTPSSVTASKTIPACK